MDQFDADRVFCCPPRTMKEREDGVKGYVRPAFDWSEIPPVTIDDDPYSKRVLESSWVVGGVAFRSTPWRKPPDHAYARHSGGASSDAKICKSCQQKD